LLCAESRGVEYFYVTQCFTGRKKFMKKEEALKLPLSLSRKTN
jgi:hypothetical protein